MATWHDGPEYAPQARPDAFAPPSETRGEDPAGPGPRPLRTRAGTPTNVPPENESPEEAGAAARAAQHRSELAPHVIPRFNGPQARVAPLGDLATRTSSPRNPVEPFAVSRSTVTARTSAWGALHGDPSQDPAQRAWGPPAGLLPTDAPPPTDPILPLRPTGPTPAAGPPPASAVQVWASATAPPPTGHPDLDMRERGALWLLAPAIAYTIGIFAGPWLGAFLGAVAVALILAPGVIRPAVRMASLMCGLLVALVALTMLADQGWGVFTSVTRFLGLVLAIVCGTWFVRERTAIDAERRRRTGAPGPYGPPPGGSA